MWLALDRMRVPGCGVPPPSNKPDINNKDKEIKYNSQKSRIFQEVRRVHRVSSDHQEKRRERKQHVHFCRRGYSVREQIVPSSLSRSTHFLGERRAEGLLVLPAKETRERRKLPLTPKTKKQIQIHRWNLFKPCGSV